MIETSRRDSFAATHRDVRLLDAHDPEGVIEYLLAHRIIQPGDLPARVERAGEGNMNLTLRVVSRRFSMIVKQGRPWVEKYDHIPAPWERTLVEAAFYRAIAGVPNVAGRMPRLLRVDEHNHVLVLEDLGTAGDFTGIYAGAPLGDRVLNELLEWLSELGAVRPSANGPGVLSNRAMRRLNHEHIFSLPLRTENGLDLERITKGLTRAAEPLKNDREYVWRVAELGEVYLADGDRLVHGDYFPGSWIHSADGVRIIDPEFGFFGAREFDYGVMLAHCALAHAPFATAAQVLIEVRREELDESLVFGFGGVEIMRRLIGVAQLPLHVELDAKRRLLELSTELVITPERGLTWWA